MIAIDGVSINDTAEMIATLHASFLTFTRFFFKILNGRDFLLSNPLGREGHFITISRELTSARRNPKVRLIINVPPGYAKSTLLVYWIAWCMARYPDSKFLYISYSKDLAAKHTETVRRIIQLPQYRELFGVYIRHDARGKEHFQTNFGGECSAFGSAGGITGRDAGMPQLDRFSGAVIMDDLHKPDEVHSDTMRKGVIRNYKETIEQRLRGVNVPMICIAQRLHEADICSFLINGGDGYEWKRVILQAIDDAGNALYPEKDPLEKLLIKKRTDIYTFASQYQQNPQPSGGSLFVEKMFPVLEFEPNILATFITADTAETVKTYNDASVFSFFGIYEIENNGIKTGKIGLHWIDCYEIRVEPKDLEYEFMAFFGRCSTYKVPPKMAVIERKSTGVTLLSVLDDLRGIEIRAVERTASSGSKADRFISMQSIVAQKLISLPKYAGHTEKTIEHMKKITANDTHEHDDRCDTLYDAIQIALVDKTMYNKYIGQHDNSIADDVASAMFAEIAAMQGAYNYDSSI